MYFQKLVVLALFPLTMTFILVPSYLFPQKYDCHLDIIKYMVNDSYQLNYSYQFSDCVDHQSYNFNNNLTFSEILFDLNHKKCYKYGPLCDFGGESAIILYIIFSLGLLNVIIWLIMFFTTFRKNSSYHSINI